MHDALQWDAALIRRYDLAGPRYTSYPTAVQLHSEIGSFDLLHALRDSRRAARPLSLYVHVPFCANICYYCACNRRSSRSPATSTPGRRSSNCTSAAAPRPSSATSNCAS